MFIFFCFLRIISLFYQTIKKRAKIISFLQRTVGGRMVTLQEVTLKGESFMYRGYFIDKTTFTTE